MSELPDEMKAVLEAIARTPRITGRMSYHDSGHWMDLPDGSRLQLRKPGSRQMNEEPVLYPPWDWT